ncbi:hypothetical protein PMAYCL1PPCAC_16787, partial [Pristionchus mayeri]
TISITIALVVTILAASFVYYKLLFHPSFADNYTFKLITINGVTAIMNGVLYLITYQLTSYPFMFPFYSTIKRIGLVTSMSLLNLFFGCIALHSSLFIALNRLKAMLELRPKGVIRRY